MNDNTNELLFSNLCNIINDEEFLTEAIQVGKFVYNYVKLQQPKEQIISEN